MNPLEVNGLIERASELVVAAMPDVVAVYVFGSAATGQYSAGSDLDLAVLCRRPLAPRETYDLARVIEAELGEDVDLVDLMTASTVLKYEVIARGRLVHCADRDTAIEFEGRSLAEHGRFLEDFAPLFQQIRESGRAYGQ